MNITKEQYARIEKYFPVQRGNVKIDNCTLSTLSCILPKTGANGGRFQKNTANGIAFTKDLKDGVKMA